MSKSLKDHLRSEAKTSVSLVLGLALGTRLVPILPLVLIARPADGKPTNVTGDKYITVHRRADTIATDLAHLTAGVLPRFLHPVKINHI